MTEVIRANFVESIVGVMRHETKHFGRAVSAEGVMYILHSCECVRTGIDPRECPYSVALDLGIDPLLWAHQQDCVVVLAICPDEGDLIPQLAEVVEDESWS